MPQPYSPYARLTADPRSYWQILMDHLQNLSRQYGGVPEQQQPMSPEDIDREEFYRKARTLIGRRELEQQYPSWK